MTARSGGGPVGLAGDAGPGDAGDHENPDDSDPREAEFLTLPPPADVRIALPDTWLSLRLGRDELGAQTARVVRAAVRRRPVLAPRTGVLTATLLDLARAARGAGGVLAALMWEQERGDALAASLVVAAAPALTDRTGAPVRTAGRCASLLRTGQTGFGDVAVAALAQCPAARVRSVAPVRAEPDGPAAPGLLVQYHVAVPGVPRRTVLSFSTPALPLAAELTEVFDLVAGSFHYVWAQGAGGSTGWLAGAPPEGRPRR